MGSYAVEWDGKNIELPSAGCKAHAAIKISVWDRQAALAQFISVSSHAGANTKSRFVEVRLIPRPDNEYNDRAISIATPPSFGGNFDDRYLGFLLDDVLDEIGDTNLPNLARYSGGELRCTGIILRSTEIRLDLPEPAELGAAIESFLSAPETPPLDSRPLLHEGTPYSSRAKQLTSKALEQLGLFGREQQIIGTISVSSVLGPGGDPRSLLLTDANNGRRIGEVVSDLLILHDERDRTSVLHHLFSIGVPVVQPRASSCGDRQGDVAPAVAERIPNILVKWQPHILAFHPVDSNGYRASPALAEFNPTTRTLWVQDSRLVGHCQVYADRLGLEVAKVSLPSRPWRLNQEVRYYGERADRNLRPDILQQLDRPPEVLRHLRDSVPEGVFSKDVVKWIDLHHRPMTETDATFVLFERHVLARTRLFGDVSVTHDIASSCRVCARPASRFTAAICSEPLAFCHRCLETAASGMSMERSAVSIALQRLAELEFSGMPMLESQLETLHVDPGNPVQASMVDQLLLLRFAICRGKWPWTRLIEEAGLAHSGLRLSRGTLIRARDGHLCLSMLEKAVDDFLHQHNVTHEREPLYPQDRELNPNGKMRADWILADGTYVEMWGFPSDQAYALKMIEKQQLAVKHGIRLVGLTSAEPSKLAGVFLDWLPEVTGASAWKWSPVSVPSEEAKRKYQEGDDADALSRTAHNTNEQTARLGRCRQAVSLQRDGLSRRQIARALGIGSETVAELLRDGKFYEDPVSNPARLAIARAAATARVRRQSKTQFREEQRLTVGKSNEAWRDASVIAITNWLWP